LQRVCIGAVALPGGEPPPLPGGGRAPLPGGEELAWRLRTLPPVNPDLFYVEWLGTLNDCALRI